MLLTTLFFFSLGQVVSPCLRYLMAVQNHLLSNTILIHPDDGDDSDSSLQGETMKVQVNTPLNTPTFVHVDLFSFHYYTTYYIISLAKDTKQLEIFNELVKEFALITFVLKLSLNIVALTEQVFSYDGTI